MLNEASLLSLAITNGNSTYFTILRQHVLAYFLSFTMMLYQSTRVVNMNQAIPVVRAAALGPLISWMRQHQKPLDDILDELGLQYLSTTDPLKPLPLHGVVQLLNTITMDEGPDFPSRVIQETSDITLAMMAPFAMAAQTPREAFGNVTKMVPYFSSHEHFVLIPNESGGVIREFWASGLDRISLHNLSQWVAKLIELLVDLTNAPGARIEKICIQPHPEHGLEFLNTRFTAPLVPASNVLAVHLPQTTLDASFLPGTPVGQMPEMPPLDCLRGANLEDTARLVIRAYLECASPTVQDVADAAGIPVRSFQRSLLKQGTSFRTLLGEVRRDTALEWLQVGERRLSDLSEALGYASPSAFTRSMRRWTGFVPSEIRSKHKRN
jgi:AraC-like DNA-binding protein